MPFRICMICPPVAATQNSPCPTTWADVKFPSAPGVTGTWLNSPVLRDTMDTVFSERTTMESGPRRWIATTSCQSMSGRNGLTRPSLTVYTPRSVAHQSMPDESSLTILTRFATWSFVILITETLSPEIRQTPPPFVAIHIIPGDLLLCSIQFTLLLGRPWRMLIVLNAIPSKTLIPSVVPIHR